MQNKQIMSEGEPLNSSSAKLEIKSSHPLHDKSYELLLKGRSLNKDDKFNQEAFDMLTKSIKLNPNLIESWIELAECYQKKSDFDGAIVCLESALKECDKPNKVVLRNLSACMRQRPADSQETKIAALLKSLELSKEALKIDLNDTHSYYNLAKAYMCLFFATECVDETLIRMSKSAFEKAASTVSNCEEIQNSVEKTIASPQEDKGQHCRAPLKQEEPKVSQLERQSDFLFNYATVLIYMQEFESAANLLEKATRTEPEWNQPKELLESLHNYIRQIHLTLIDLTKNSKKSSRRYKKVVDALENVSNLECMIIPDEKRLRKCSKIELKPITIKELVNQLTNTPEPHKSQHNIDKSNQDSITLNALHIKLLFTINYNQAMYLTFIAIDKDYSFTVVTIHNLSIQHSPTNRDVFTIIEPKMDNVVVNLKPTLKDTVTYHRINIKQYKDFYINGRRISLGQVAKPQVRMSMMPDQEKNNHIP